MTGKDALLFRLEAYAAGDCYPLHMPGHKRNLEMSASGGGGNAAGAAGTLAAAAALDITEIDGFDNLHEPEGILREAMERAARLYGADHTFYSVNGSTAGLLIAISAAVPEGGKLVMARNCHKAVYHAVYLRRLQPVYLYPETAAGLDIADAVTPEQVEKALLAHPDAAAVLLTSPTYDGIAADVKEIAELVHRYDIPLIVDAAHGAHFGFHPGFPDSPVHLGADLTVMSLHKTMPCMTQTALLHVRGSRVGLDRIRLFGGIYQTSSPSYFLMAAMDHCVRLTEEKGAALWDSFFKDREDFLKKAEKLTLLRVFTAGRTSFGTEEGGAKKRRMDAGKILIGSSAAGLTGKELYDILRERYHLQPEMAAGNYVTAIMTCCDRSEGWRRLADALYEIDQECGQKSAGCRTAATEQNGGDRRTAAAAQTDGGCGTAATARKGAVYPRLERACSISDALDAPLQTVSLELAKGKVSGAFINLYPPGIPLAVPGELLSGELIELIKAYRRQNLPLCGLQGDAVIIIKD